jgi:hypothetical protein
VLYILPGSVCLNGCSKIRKLGDRTLYNSVLEIKRLCSFIFGNK